MAKGKKQRSELDGQRRIREGATTSATTAILQNSMHVTLFTTACRLALRRIAALLSWLPDG
jgi:hypothetical protein